MPLTRPVLSLPIAGIASLFALSALIGLAPRPALAQTPALAFTGASFFTDNRDFMIGWQFSLSNPVTISALGYFDQASNGLLGPHRVGIFDNGGVLLIDGTVPTGTAGTLVDGFRYTSALTGLTALPAGTYVIGAQISANSPDPFALAVPAANVTTAPGVTYLQERELLTSSFVVPTVNIPGSERGVFGPNFLIGSAASSAAPEPASLALLALSGLPVAGAVVRRRRAA
jgi:hypothetical protein